MRGLAELAMRGPKQAVTLSVLFACVPVLFWLSGAIVSLVVLSRGVGQGLKVLAWAVLPSIAWAATGHYSALTGLLATVSLACVLRITMSWQKTLLLLVPVGILIALMFDQLAIIQITQLSGIVTEFLGNAFKQSGTTPTELGVPLEPLIHYGVVGILAWFNLINCTIGLALARSWQAWLYKPGGFREEFHAIKLPALMSCALLAASLVGITVSPAMMALLPIASLPLFVAGLALVHGLVDIRKLGSLWLVMFYVMVVLFTQVAYPVIVLMACLDSVLDFRTRAKHKLHQG